MAAVEITPPLGDGTWWLVQCHICRELTAVDNAHKAEDLRSRHEADHADGTVVTPRLARLHAALGGTP